MLAMLIRRFSVVMWISGTVVLSPYVSKAEIITFDFSGGPAFNPAPFAGTPIHPFLATQPTISANSTADVLNFVRQTNAGLGVITSQDIVADGFNPDGPQSRTIENVGPSETLTLVFNASDPNIANSQLLGVSINPLQNGPQLGIDNFNIFVDGGLVGSFDFNGDLSGGFLDLSGFALFLDDGSTISFSSNADLVDAFSVSGATVEIVSPEPTSYVVWSLLLVASWTIVFIRSRDGQKVFNGLWHF